MSRPQELEALTLLGLACDARTLLAMTYDQELMADTSFVQLREVFCLHGGPSDSTVITNIQSEP